MAGARTVVTELATGLGMLGLSGDGLSARAPAELRGVDDAAWATLLAARDDDDLGPDLGRAVENGRAFLAAEEALDRRLPRVVEWRGPTRAPGDEVVPIDLRVDHVYLVSCKYLSRIVINASPSHLFDRLLSGGHGRRAGHDWYELTAPAEYQTLYDTARAVAGWGRLPAHVSELRPADRELLRRALPGRLDGVLAERYAALCGAVAVASGERWARNIAAGADADTMLRRLLRIGSAPYFVLGSAPTGSLRLRIGTAWDWRQRYETSSLDLTPLPAGQPCVAWTATVRDRIGGTEVAVTGHVEIRWSHGKFGGPPEAKVYLDTPHHQVPGYVPLR